MLDVSFSPAATRQLFGPMPYRFSVLAVIEGYLDTEICIKGHTDCTGEGKCSQVLSEKQAQVVREWFTAQGCNLERLITLSSGKTKPEASNDLEEGCHLPEVPQWCFSSDATTIVLRYPLSSRVCNHRPSDCEECSLFLTHLLREYQKA